MDKGLVEPAHDAVFDSICEELICLAAKRRSGIIRLDWLDLIDHVARRQCLSIKTVSDHLVALLDQGWLKKADLGFWFRSEKRSAEVGPNPRAAGREGGSLVAERLGADDAVLSVFTETSAASRTSRPEASEASRTGVKQESAQNRIRRPSGPRVELCRDFFPDLVEDRGLETVRRDIYWRGLMQQVKKLEFDYRVDTPFIRKMMLEFVEHPIWCKRSRSAAWKVFIQHREELVKLVRTQRTQHDRNPHNRGQSKEFWTAPSRDRHTLGAEYWLARR